MLYRCTSASPARLGVCLDMSMHAISGGVEMCGWCLMYVRECLFEHERGGHVHKWAQ